MDEERKTTVQEAPTISVVCPASTKFGRKEDRSVEFPKSFGDNLADASARFTEDVVFSNWLAAVTVRCQAIVRARLAKLKEDGTFMYTKEQSIQAGLDYTPQKAAVRIKKDPFDALAEKVISGEMTQKDLQKAIADRIAALGG